MTAPGIPPAQPDSVGDERWGAKALVLNENIEHHIGEKEREMFRQARQVFDAREPGDLGVRMDHRTASAGRELGIPVSTR